MNAALVLVLGLALFYLGYRFYSRYLAHHVFSLDPANPTPARQQEDGVDFVPTNKHVLFGHHFSSIAGAAPIVGPAIAVIWGWVPALIWVVFGTILLGAVHDFSALVLSMRNRGCSIGGLCEIYIGPRSRNLFLLIIFFLIWMVLAVFVLVIANLFISYPGSVLPINFEIAVALAIGFWLHKKKGKLLVPSLIALVLLYVTVWLGSMFPFSVADWVGEQNQLLFWVGFLLFYSFVASVLPVWSLLQPRDFINSHQLLVGLSLLILGILILRPEIVAPAIHFSGATGAPPWFPMLFVTVACGAISGFHGLVSSGTTSKQVETESDARIIGYGGMIGEGTLALLATLAVAAGFKTTEAWHHHYGSWNEANGLAQKLSAFVGGSSRFLETLGISESLAQTLMAVLVISFAATSLDTATRIQRYILAEVGKSYGIKSLENRFFASGLAVLSALVLILSKEGLRGGLAIWPLFGTTNQLLASLTLLIVTIAIMKRKRNYLPALIPCLIVTAVTLVAMVANLLAHIQAQNWLLALLGAVIMALQLWVILEGALAIGRLRVAG